MTHRTQSSISIFVLLFPLLRLRAYITCTKLRTSDTCCSEIDVSMFIFIAALLTSLRSGLSSRTLWQTFLKRRSAPFESYVLFFASCDKSSLAIFILSVSRSSRPLCSLLDDETPTNDFRIFCKQPRSKGAD